MPIAIHAEQQQKDERLELKYCEGCGALTLRPSPSAEIYCPRCAKKFVEIARRREAGRRAAQERKRP